MAEIEPSAHGQPLWPLLVEQLCIETIISDVADPAKGCFSSWHGAVPSGDEDPFLGSLLALLASLYSQGWKKVLQEGNSKIYIRLLPWNFFWRSLFLHGLLINIRTLLLQSNHATALEYPVPKYSNHHVKAHMKVEQV